MAEAKSPERIYLQWDPEGPGNVDISWCDEKINDDDLEFYRADVVKIMEETASKQGYALGFAAKGQQNQKQGYREGFAAAGAAIGKEIHKL